MITGRDNKTATPNTAMGAALQAARENATASPAGNTPSTAGAAPQTAQTRAASTPPPQATMNTNPRQARTGGQTFTFRDLGRTANSAMGRTPAAEVLVKLEKAMLAVYENINKQFEVTLIPGDMANNPRLNVSVLIVAMRSKTQPEIGVSFHTLVLAGSVDAPAPRIEQINGKPVERIVTVGEAYDERMISAVADMVGRVFPDVNLHNADGCVVPRDFDLADQNLVFKLAGNAAFANSTELSKASPDFVDMNLVNAAGDETLTVRTAFNDTQLIDPVGQPVRTGITLDLTAAPIRQQGDNSQALDRSTVVARVAGFIDLVWAPAQAQANVYAPYANAGQPISYQRYAPRFVMTTMETAAVLTPAAQLLTLVQALALHDNAGYVQYFQPNAFQEGKVDFEDIGAVGIEANFENNPNGYGSRIDTHAATFTSEGNLGRLVAATISQGLIFSLDVDECGPSTWFHSMFAAAAEGSQKATEVILQAANDLTNGNFSRHYQGNGRVVTDEDNRVHLGYYVDGNGVKQDLRKIGYLAVLNAVGDRDPSIVRTWSDTFLRTDVPLPVRLDDRKRIITGIVPSAVFTGFARRVTFEKDMLAALAAGCLDCGLDVRSQMPYADQGNFERATAQFAGSTLFSGGPTGVFNRGGGYQGAAQGNRGFSQARWF
jgi:hypothetical protein